MAAASAHRAGRAGPPRGHVEARPATLWRALGTAVSSAAAAEALEVTAVLHSRGLWPPQSGPGRRNRWTGGPVHIGKGLQVYLSFHCQRMGMYGK